MSSGEVLFILAFIVLPTAILVSSVWAVLFVRRRPDRAVQRPEAYPVASGAEEQPTAMMASLENDAGEPVAAAAFDNDLPVTEHDVVVITDEDLPAVDDQPVEHPDDAFFAEESDPEPESPVDVAPIEETPVLQSTEDLGDVVDVLRDMQHIVEPDEPVADVEPEQEPEPEPGHAVPSVPDEPEPEQVEFLETSELPVIEQPSPDEPGAGETQPEVAQEQEQESRQAAGGPGWRRRKQAVKLVPGDADAPRARSRNRDAQRQVPQLGRSGRKRDGSDQSPLPESDVDEDTTSARS